MKNKTIKIISALLAAALLAATWGGVYAEILGGFGQTNIYDNSVYSDVNSEDWYGNYVAFAYEYGIMTGTSRGVFSPNGNLTVAEAITVAARLNAAHYGNTIGDVSGISGLSAAEGIYSYPVNGDGEFVLDEKVKSGAKTKRFFRRESTEAQMAGDEESGWFLPYLAYAVGQGIISENTFGGRYFETVTREESAFLLYRALPDCYNKINDIGPIPDVSADGPYYREILALFESGVVTGNDEYGTFYPYSPIARSEVAAMVSRIINTDLRVRFSLNPNIPVKFLHYTWKCPGSDFEYSMDIQISHYDYNYFNRKPRVYDYAAYATDDADVTGLTALADSLKSLGESYGYTSDYDLAAFVSAFVQSIPYVNDIDEKKVSEYPKYPIETLFDHTGDCEDKAALLGKLLKLLGYETVLLVSDDHMAVGLKTSGRGNLTYGGANYYYIETTELGWRVGEVPGDMLGVTMEILYI